MSTNTQSKVPEVQGSAWLVINKQVIPLNQIVTSIGRRLDNDVVIQDQNVSRRHAEIRYENGRFVLYDLNSTGGTYVNNKQIDKVVLKMGDVVVLAIVPFVFVEDRLNIVKTAEKTTDRLGEEKAPDEEKTIEFKKQKPFLEE
ncbi:MAG: FHA domain-containing protein [Anaerolineales bacterium]|nr:FHA domain-containing protein [Anaerolineales bacterium]